jgi:ATP:ADP antiporter, AAA family
MNPESLRVQRRPGHWPQVLPLLLLLGIDSVIGQFADVVATSSFIEQLGIGELPWLWIVWMALSVAATTLFALLVDRSRRVSLLSGVLLALFVAYSVVALLIGLDAPEPVIYPLLYLVTEVQYIVFPLALWALAGDLFSLSAARRAFPLIAGGAAAGNILGSALAALLAVMLGAQGAGTAWTLGAAALLWLLALTLLRLTLGRSPVRSRLAARSKFDLRADLRVGWEFFSHVPLFRDLAATIFLAGLSFTVLEFSFLREIDAAFAHRPAAFETFYSTYKLLLFSALWVVQGLISGLLTSRVELKRSFLALPLTLALGLCGLVLFPVLGVVVLSQFTARLVQWGWDHPSRSVLLGLVPDERRGRISSVINSFVYAASTLVGSALLLLCLALEGAQALSAALAVRLPLGLALLAALGAIWYALRLRQSYDRSLLNWRLARSRRRGPLEDRSGGANPAETRPAEGVKL